MARCVRTISREMGLLSAPFFKARPALAISGVLVASFLASFALMWRAWNTSPAAVPVSAASPRPMSAREPRLLPAPAAAAPDHTPMSAAARPAAPVRPAPPDAEAAEETDASGPMPLGINVYNRRNRHRYEGYVQNTSNRPLSVTLEVVAADGRGNSTLQLELPAWGRQDFSSDSGFDMQSNDRIVVHSDPYQDITVVVP